MPPLEIIIRNSKNDGLKLTLLSFFGVGGGGGCFLFNIPVNLILVKMRKKKEMSLFSIV